MRHGKKFNHLSRQKGHRRALMANLAVALIENKRIFTSLAKAKALRTYIEPLVTRSKDNTTHNRRVVFSYLQDKHAVSELFTTVSAAIGNRPGGYVRVIKTGFRQGDGSETAMIEFVDFNTVYEGATASKGRGGKKKTRRGRGKSAAATSPAPQAAAAATATEAASSEEE